MTDPCSAVGGAIMAALECASRRLRDVWQAVERWDDRKYREEKARAVLGEYEAIRTAEETDGP